MEIKVIKKKQRYLFLHRIVFEHVNPGSRDKRILNDANAIITKAIMGIILKPFLERKNPDNSISGYTLLRYC
jgi:hypothetical protein